MLQQKPDSKKILVKTHGIILPLLGGIILFFISCKNDIEKIHALALGPERPTMTYTNITSEYTDTAKLQAKLFFPIVHHYLNIEKPYFEAPEGINIIFYNDDESEKSTITAKYGIYTVESELYEIRDSVVVTNLEEGQKIETEQMFWDQSKQIIYSDVFTKISNENGVHFGEKGFKATQDLSSYTLIGSKGKVRVKDEK